jgi:hypothetical protein
MAFKNIGSFTPMTDTQAEQYFATHLPKGRLTARRYDNTSNLYKLIYVLADFAKQVSMQIYQFIYNLNILMSDVLLPNWEAAVGIPNVIPRLNNNPGSPLSASTNAQIITARQQAVLQLISKIPVIDIQNANWKGNLKTTVEQYVLNLTGISVTIIAGVISGQTNMFTSAGGILFVSPSGILFQPSFNVQNMNWIINVHVGAGAVPNNTFTGTPLALTFPVLFFSASVPLWEQQLLTLVLQNVIPSFCSFSFNSIP